LGFVGAAHRVIVCRGLPGSKFLFLLRQEKEPKEDDPAVPVFDFPPSVTDKRAALNSPRFLLDFRCQRGSNMQRCC
jgi:hypothetical protein